MIAWFLNLGPSSTTLREADADIRAILNTDPSLFLGCESIGKGGLPDHPGQGKIRDTKNEGRANLFAYAKGLRGKGHWRDCRVPFPRVEHPHLGLHPPRSILPFPYRGMQVVCGHKPPDWNGAGPARAEHDTRLRRLMAPWTNEASWKRTTRANKDAALARPRLLLWDSNMHERQNLEQFAESMRAEVTGDKIDCAIHRNIKVLDSGYRDGVEGHRFATDHPWGAFFIEFKLEES